MAHSRLGTAIQRWLHGLTDPKAELTDGVLLARFVRHRDEEAFELLVRRHGSLVLGVCRQLLRDEHDAEDAFQAAFLVLACRAGSIRRTESAASFLYVTASRIARRLRAQRARRQALHQAAASRRPEVVADAEDRDDPTCLHEELNHLPRRYRDALVLCYLQGKTHEQAAREMGCPPGSMSRHLSRARELLRERLLGRGVIAGLAGSVLTEPASAALVRGTVETVRRHALASALRTGSTPVAVILAHGALRAMGMTRALVGTLLVGILATAGAVTAYQVQTAKPSPAEAKASAPTDTARAQPRPRLDLYGDPLPEGVLARMGTERLRHPSALRVMFAADGATLISAGQDQAVRFWDLASGKLQRSQHVPHPIRALSPDGRTLVLQSEEHLHIWDIAAARDVQRIATGTLAGNKQLVEVEISPDGKTIAAFDRDRTVLLWDVASGKEGTRFQHGDRGVMKLAFSPDVKQLAVAGEQNILLWDLAAGKEQHVIRRKQPQAACGSLVFSPDGKRLGDTTFLDASLWDVMTGKQEAYFQFDSTVRGSTGYEVAFAPDNKMAAVGYKDFVVLWDWERGEEVKRLKGYSSSSWAIGRLGFSRDGKRLASWHLGRIIVWDVATGEQIQERASHSGAADSVAFSPDGKLLASASGGDRTVRLWNARTGKQLHMWPMPHPRINPVMFTPDSASVIAGGLWGECRMWDVRTGAERHVFRLPDVSKQASDMILSLHVSPDGKHLMAMDVRGETIGGVHKRRRFVTTWDATSGERIARRATSLDNRTNLEQEAISPDGRFATLWENELLVFDIVANRVLRKITGDTLAPTAFSADSKLMAIGGAFSSVRGSERVRVLDVASGKELLSLPTGPVWRRAFSPDGRFLATTGDGGLALWEMATGKPALQRAVANKERAQTISPFSASCLAFAPDGRAVATSLADGSLLIWDVAPAARQKRRLSAGALDLLWADLVSDDAARAYQAAGSLITDPERTVPYLRERLQPVKADVPRIRQLIANLDSEQFAVRDAAEKELEKMDDAAYGVLREALKVAKSLEMRRRLESLLTDPFVLREPEKLRQVRAVMVLEHVGDAESRHLLERLAGGVADARLTREAKAALSRLRLSPAR